MERDLSLDALLRPYGEYSFFENLEEVGPVFASANSANSAKSAKSANSEISSESCASGGSRFDPAMAWLLAEASMLAYARDEDMVRSAWDCVGCTDLHFFDANGAQGYIAIRDDAVILVFRGTEPDDLHDVIADMKFMLVPHEKSGLVHHGFIQALNAVWDQLEPIFEAAKPRPVWVAGHSLGAALALLAGERLGGAQAVYTYGAPRIGSRGFRDQYPCPVYRLVNNNDIVTMIPPPVLYRHVGEEWFIDHEGRVRREGETTMRQRMESRLLGHWNHAGEVFKLWRQREFLNAIPNSNVTDHAPVNYVRPLRAAIGRSTFRVDRLLKEASEFTAEERADLARRLLETNQQSLEMDAPGLLIDQGEDPSGFASGETSADA